MQLHLLPFTTILSLAFVAEAFVPNQQLLDLQKSFGAVIQRAAESVPLKSSRAEPISTNADLFPKKKAANKVATPLTMKKTIKQKSLASRNAVEYKRWGIDNNNEEEYWHDSRIHTLGNDGFMGAVHAALAPISTKMIDKIAYEGIDIRGKVAEELSAQYKKKQAKVLDLCCGVGFSTRALYQAFPDAETIVGVDTSPQMLAMARFISAHVGHLRPMWNSVVSKGYQMKLGAKKICSTNFTKGNAENTPFKDASFDVVTIMYAFHEAPRKGRQRILKEARRLLSPGGVLAVIDISTDFEPSKSMLAGEPYVIEYQKNIHNQLGHQRGFSPAQYKSLVPGHVDMWVLKKSMLA